MQDKAVAKVDAEGKATLDVSETVVETDSTKWLGANVPGAGGDKAEKSTLAKVTGGGEKPKTDDTHVEGIAAGGSDLAALAAAAQDPAAWMTHCPSPRLRGDWSKARFEVLKAGGTEAACATALAKFVGKGGPGREEVVDQAIRGGTGGGSRYEFPEGLGHLRAPYAELIQGNVMATIDAAVKSDGAVKAVDMAKGLLARIDSMGNQMRSSAGAFQDASRYGEMMDKIASRKSELDGKVRALSGGAPDQLTQDEWRAKYNDALTLCMDFKSQEDNFFGKMNEAYKPGALDKLFGSDGHADLGETVEIEKYRSQLRELHARWTPKYDAMARIAQEHDFGKDTYWRFKPDVERLKKSAVGAPGAATAPVPEVEDKRSKPVPPPAPKPPVDPQAEKVKRMRGQATALVNQLDKKIRTMPAGWDDTQAYQCYKGALEKLNATTMKLGEKPDWKEVGGWALDEYTDAWMMASQGLKS